MMKEVQIKSGFELFLKTRSELFPIPDPHPGKQQTVGNCRTTYEYQLDHWTRYKSYQRFGFRSCFFPKWLGSDPVFVYWSDQAISRGSNPVNLSYDEGGPYVPPKCFYFFTKNLSPWPKPETHLLIPNFGFTLPWIYFSSENLVYKKFYNINSSNFLNVGGGGSKCPPIFICENNRKSNKIMHCVEFFFEW